MLPLIISDFTASFVRVITVGLRVGTATLNSAGTWDTVVALNGGGTATANFATRGAAVDQICSQLLL